MLKIIVDTRLYYTYYLFQGSLADFLKGHTITLNEGLQIMKTMASGMSFLHEDIQTK